MTFTVPNTCETYPVRTLFPQLEAALPHNRAVIVSAEPGSGKTTLIPLFLRERLKPGESILILEPRRMAAKLAAERVAALLGENVGETVGYCVRNENRISAQTRILFLTEGILTRRIREDAELSGVAFLLFDEFHERSLHADLGLALASEIQQTLRDDLRILILSATLDTERLSARLDNAPVLHAQGRCFPVDVIDCGALPPAFQDRMAHLLRITLRAFSETSGDILVFLPGWGEIHALHERLLSAALPNTLLLPLHSSCTKSEQDRAVRRAPVGMRKIILSGAIAESSLTIEGIEAVVDAGLERRNVLDCGSGMNRLVTRPASQAALEQRRGRAGRLGPGRCYRALAPRQFAALAPFPIPEIKQGDLTAFALELAGFGLLNTCDTLCLLDSPEGPHLESALALLRQLNALDAENRITPHGRRLLRYPTHVRLAHMIESAPEALKPLACECAAMLSEPDPLIRSAFNHALCDLRERHALIFGASPDFARLDRARLNTLKTTAQTLKRDFAPRNTRAGTDDFAALLVEAFPERIARQRTPGSLNYRLASGRGVSFPDHDALAAQKYLVVPLFDEAEAQGIIRLAAALDETDLQRLPARLLASRTRAEYDSEKDRISAVRETRIGEIVLKTEPLSNLSSAALADILIDVLKKEGLSRLPWDVGALRTRERLAFAFAHAPDRFPDVSDTALLADTETFLRPLLENVRRFADIPAARLEALLMNRLSYAQHRELDAFAPLRFTVPSGSALRIDYADFKQPMIHVRLQEVFGLTASPRLAAGRVPLVFDLLSPARRTVQITADLAAFWQSSYFLVRKDMRGRYPKHNWPENPLEATASTRSLKPRQ